jgi:hypothetical protein
MVMKKRDDDPSAGYPGTASPEGSLASKAPAGPSTNEPDGDASGRPGSATRAKPTTGDAPSPPAKDEPAKSEPPENAIPAGSVRVKAKKTALVGGMARSAGEIFTMSESEFNDRKDRDEFEKL